MDILYKQTLELASQRGMKVSKAAARLGCSPGVCKNGSVTKTNVFKHVGFVEV